MTNLLIEAGYDDATITLRTGHKDIRSPRSYHRPCGDIGLNRLRKLFRSSSDSCVESDEIEDGNN